MKRHPPVIRPADLAAQLRRWTAQHDPHVQAAVELLIEHGTWLRRPDFTNACIQRSGSHACIDWDAARAFTDAGARASTSETAVLDLAVALGENRYRLSIMGDANARAIATAVSRAVGLTAREPAHQAQPEAGAR